LIENATSDDIRLAMMEDLVAKCRSLPDAIRWKVMGRALVAHTPHEVRDLFAPEIVPFQTTLNDPIDVAIVTVIGPELRSAKRALGIPVDGPEDELIAGMRYWHASLSNQETGDDLSVVLILVGEARNAPCAIACARLFTDFDVDTAVLVGISAGRNDEDKKLNFCDVVVAEQIVDFEGASLTDSGPRKRPWYYHLRPPLPRDLSTFQPYDSTSGWLVSYNSLVGQLEDDEKPPAAIDRPSLKRGVIVAGEKLFRMNHWGEMLAEDYHDQILAAEMEGSGFARCCEEYDVRWMDFRGVSDDGTELKTNDWQSAASLSAATAAVAFIRTAYRRSPQRHTRL
jgi:nucleoside phosphorylase